MTDIDLYEQFDRVFTERILPELETRLPRDWDSEPIYYYLDEVYTRKFRSGLGTLLCEALELDPRPAEVVGAATEILWATLLVMDDIIDEDTTRTGLEAAHVRYGLPRTTASIGLALGAVDSILAQLGVCALAPGVLTAMRRRYADATMGVMRSFLWERRRAHARDITTAQLMELFVNKTITGAGALSSVGAHIEGVRGGSFETTLFQYANQLGIAGQLKNDVQDFSILAEGRAGSSDVKNGYINFPILLTIEHPDTDTPSLRAALAKGDERHLIAEMGRVRAVEHCVELAHEAAERAVATLEELPLTPQARILLIRWANCNRIHATER